MALVDAYDIKTGQKLPYLVPEEHFDHPKLGKRIAPLPSNGKPPAAQDAPPAEPGSVAEAHQLKGQALDDAIADVPELSKTGTADEKRARLAEHRLSQLNPVPQNPDATDGAEDNTDTPPAGDD